MTSLLRTDREITEIYGRGIALVVIEVYHRFVIHGQPENGLQHRIFSQGRFCRHSVI